MKSSSKENKRIQEKGVSMLGTGPNGIKVIIHLRRKKRYSEKKHFQGLEYSKGEDSQRCIMLLQETLGSKDSSDESCRNLPAACLQGSMGVIFLSHTDCRDSGVFAAR